MNKGCGKIYNDGQNTLISERFCNGMPGNTCQKCQEKNQSQDKEDVRCGDSTLPATPDTQTCANCGHDHKCWCKYHKGQRMKYCMDKCHCNKFTPQIPRENKLNVGSSNDTEETEMSMSRDVSVFCLSDKIEESPTFGSGRYMYMLYTEDVKEFIRLLKEIPFYKIVKDFQYCGVSDEKANLCIKEQIDKLAGGNLI